MGARKFGHSQLHHAVSHYVRSRLELLFEVDVPVAHEFRVPTPRYATMRRDLDARVQVRRGIERRIRETGLYTRK